MAKHDSLDTEDKVRLLRALAHHVHRKRALDEVLTEQVEQELRGSRRRLYRAAAEALAEGAVLTALRALELVGEEAGLMLDLIIESGDHRQLSTALNRLADFVESAA
ncbi:MAG TPA: hypothetical protein VL974_06015 [Magnetospirillum sp.]|jgi:hypothetical protein|nr:hypothetical protein [Magnetospirillum sp.]